MGPSKRTLAIVALTTTLVGCSNQSLPATTPTTSAESLLIGATTATYPLALDLATAYNASQPFQSLHIRYADFRALLEDLLSGETLYFIGNHLPANSTLWAAPVAQDAIVIIINADVNVSELAIGQLRAIYQGHATHWSELGGAPLEIVVFSREDGSGARSEFERMVMGRRRTTSNARIAPSSAHMIDCVAQVSGSIGYVSMGYYLGNTVRVIAVDGILPTTATVLDNRYPLRSTIYVIGLAEPEGRYRALIGWMQSPAGQAAVTQRYAPLMYSAPDGE